MKMGESIDIRDAAVLELCVPVSRFEFANSLSEQSEDGYG